MNTRQYFPSHIFKNFFAYLIKNSEENKLANFINLIGDTLTFLLFYLSLNMIEKYISSCMRQ